MRILRGGSDFAAMDFPTRDLYRRAIEELARSQVRTKSTSPNARSRPHGARDIRRRTMIRVRGAKAIRDIISSPRAAACLEKELGCRVPFKT